MFGFSLASQIFQGSTERTWNCVAHLANLFWNKFNHLRHPVMPRSRKRHHTHSRSRSRSHSRDRSHEKQKKLDSHEKDGKRRKVESYESPQQKRSVSYQHPSDKIEEFQATPSESFEESQKHTDTKTNTIKEELESDAIMETENVNDHEIDNYLPMNPTNQKQEKCPTDISNEQNEKQDRSSDFIEVDSVENDTLDDSKIDASDSDADKDKSLSGSSTKNTPKKLLTSKQMKKKLESEQKRQEKVKEREEQKKKKEEEKERMRQQKLKHRQEKEAERQRKEVEKQKLLELKQREKELKEEQRRKEKEEKEQKRKEKEEREEQKRREKEQEKMKRQQEIEEKNKEKQKEEEKKQKAAAAFVNFFVAKKPDSFQEDRKSEVAQSYFMPFEIKSDMKLPPKRRAPLTQLERNYLEEVIDTQMPEASYLQDLNSGKHIGKGSKTLRYEESDDVTVIEEGNFGETICEDTSKVKKLRAKFLMFHENKRPPYFGTWRKESSFISARNPFGTDKDAFNYEEDSDDDWEEEEQGESLNGSDDEADKENDDEKDDYEVDNEFFVPHGHLSDDEVDDEANARLSPESLKQKLKLLHDEFEEDMKSKTHKLKPRSIGCIWYNKDGSNVDESIHRYLEPFAIIANGQIIIKKRSDIFNFNNAAKKSKVSQELPSNQIPIFLKIVHGNVNNQKTLIEQFMSQMFNNGIIVNASKSSLIKNLKQMATWKKCQENGPMKNKFAWFVNDDVKEKYIDIALTSKNNN